MRPPWDFDLTTGPIPSISWRLTFTVRDLNGRFCSISRFFSRFPNFPNVSTFFSDFSSRNSLDDVLADQLRLIQGGRTFLPQLTSGDHHNHEDREDAESHSTLAITTPPVDKCTHTTQRCSHVKKRISHQRLFIAARIKLFFFYDLTSSGHVRLHLLTTGLLHGRPLRRLQ